MERAESPFEGEAVSEFASLDGLLLRCTVTGLNVSPSSVAVLVHGGGVTRDEAGFFTRLAAGLAGVGVASLRFDLRGHGDSEGSQEELTLSGILNDIRAAVEYAKAVTGCVTVNLVGASFSGGICGLFAARHPGLLRRLVLLNPLINYKKRFIDDKPYWADDHIDLAAGRQLLEHGYLVHSPTFKLGRPLLNEVFHLRPDLEIGDIETPTLFVHGTGDTFIPVDSSRRFVGQIAANASLVEIEGAQHGFAVPDDPRYADPRSLEYQREVIAAVADWLS